MHFLATQTPPSPILCMQRCYFDISSKTVRSPCFCLRFAARICKSFQFFVLLCVMFVQSGAHFFTRPPGSLVPSPHKKFYSLNPFTYLRRRRKRFFMGRGKRSHETRPFKKYHQLYTITLLWHDNRFFFKIQFHCPFFSLPIFLRPILYHCPFFYCPFFSLHIFLTAHSS